MRELIEDPIKLCKELGIPKGQWPPEPRCLRCTEKLWVDYAEMACDWIRDGGDLDEGLSDLIPDLCTYCQQVTR